MPKGIKGFQKGIHTKTEFKKGQFAWNKGKKLTDEHKKKINTPERAKKISQALKGKKLSEATKEKIKKSKLGSKHSKKTREKMSKIMKGRKITWGKKISQSLKGEKCYNWKGGITPENKRIRHGIEFRLWRETIFARDNWTCQKCGKRGGELHPHHIKGFAEYPELRFAIDNGLIFCVNCHKEIHSNC